MNTATEEDIQHNPIVMGHLRWIASVARPVPPWRRIFANEAGFPGMKLDVIEGSADFGKEFK
jgi:hypothetical protein